MAFFSIIIPVYNKKEYLEQCFDSLSQQTFDDWEAIVVDDGSTDGSGYVCDNWAQRNPKFKVLHQSNSGVSAARNKALELAQGQYVQFTDADDWLKEEALDAAFSSLRRYNYPDLLIFGYIKVNEDGTAQSVAPAHCGPVNRKFFFKDLIKKQKLNGVYGSVCNKFIKRDLLKRNKILFQRYTLLEDYDFFLDAYYHSERIAEEQSAVYCYRQKAANSTSSPNFNIPWVDVIAVRIKAYLYVKKECGESPGDVAILQSELNGLYLGMFLSITSATPEELKEKHRKIVQLLPEGWTIQATGSTLHTHVLSFFINRHWWRALSLYISIRSIFKR